MSVELNQLLQSLLEFSRESEWVEFKHNNATPENVGEYLSALSNSAMLHGKDEAYIVWGVEDVTHRVVGTSFRPHREKIGNEELENWLARQLVPRLQFRIEEWEREGQPMVLFRVKPCMHTPTRWRDTEFIRVGSCNQRLKDYPEKERALWGALTRTPFEKGLAASRVKEDEVLAILDYPKFFELANAPLPTDRTGILDRLAQERLVNPQGEDSYDITNLGALLFARRLSAFDTLKRKAMRIIKYAGVNRIKTEREHAGVMGYAAGFKGMVSFINSLLPQNEFIGEALRQKVRVYPELAIRELAVNALIHQDFSLSGTGPMVELFDDRMEISNPGVPLIPPLRFIDHSPRSRNEMLADLMRRLHICEERGTGIDKVIFEIEFHQLPPLDIQIDSTHTRVVLFAHQSPSRMDRKDKVRACYQHCCLLRVTNQAMTNATVRGRFKIDEEDYSIASKIIRDTIAAELVKPRDPENKSNRLAKYVPFWA